MCGWIGKRELGGNPCAADELAHVACGHGSAALGDEHVGAFGPLAPQLAQGTQFWAAQRVLGRHALPGREIAEHMGLRIHMTTYLFISRSEHSALGRTEMHKFKPFSAAC